MVELRQITHGYSLPNGEQHRVLDGVSMALKPGGFHAILGRSGCGKSTLLRLMAGLETPNAGTLEVPAGQIGVVFQEPRLMPWLTVEQNVGFLLKGRLAADEVAARTAHMLRAVGLWEMRARWPSQLSGGMAQRVALARALVEKPTLLLMDEPFGALDAFTRKQMQDELVVIWQKTQTTIVFVTHDIEEAVRLGERVFVLEAGRMALQFDISASYPRDGTEHAINAARQRLLDQLFARACVSFQPGLEI